MKRNYRNASAYGRSVRFLRGAWGAMAGGAVAALCYMALVLALVAAAAFETGCSSGGGAAGTPDSVSSVDMVGGGTDASLTEVGADSAGGDAGNTDTVGVDNGADVGSDSADAADSTDSGSPDVGEDVAKTCPPADRPNDVVPIAVSGGIECVPDQNWKTYLNKVPGTDWYNSDTTVETCESATMELLPATFQTTEQGWGEVGVKPAKYTGKPMLTLMCANLGNGAPIYFGVDSCTDQGCLATAPDWNEADHRWKIWFSFENGKVRADFTDDAIDMHPSGHAEIILYRKSE